MRISTWFCGGLVVGLDHGAGRDLLHRGADLVDLGASSGTRAMIWVPPENSTP